MNAHTEHTATLARVIAADAQCQCSGACRNGRDTCTCGLDMPPVPAEACTELGSTELQITVRLPRVGFLHALAVVTLIVGAAVYA